MVDKPIVFIENTGFQELTAKYYKRDNKLSKDQESSYAKAYETYVGQLFGTILPRTSSSDTRPDIPITKADVDKLLENNQTEDSTIFSFLDELRQNLAKLEEGVDFQSLREAFVNAANTEKDPNRRLSLLQTIGGIEIKGSFGIDLLGGSDDSLKISRKTPRGLTGRQINIKSILGGVKPEGSGLVIPIVTSIDTSKVEAKRLARTIKDFFDRAKDNLHSAITGEYSGTDPKLLYFKNSVAVKQIRAKGQNLWMQYIIRSGATVKSYSAYLPESFKVQNTNLQVQSSSLYIAYTTAYENKVLERLKTALQNKSGQAVDKIIKDSDIKNLLLAPPDVTTQILVPSGGSIPISTVKYPNTYIPRINKAAFQSRINSIVSILRETRGSTKTMGDFITDDTITALTKREMLRRMPIGPVGGPPKSSRVLTYRTGRFVNSLQVMANIRTQNMQYYYDPNYWVHEATSRNPKDLIGSSLNSVTRSLFGKRFNLIKANQSLE